MKIRNTILAILAAITVPAIVAYAEIYDNDNSAARASLYAQKTVPGDQSLQTDSSGNLKVTLSGGTAATQDVNLKQVAGSAVTVGNGVVTANTPRVTIASDSTGQSKIVDSAGTNQAGVNTLRQVLIDTTGLKATYGVTVPLTAVAATPTDMFCLVGSGSKTVKVIGGTGSTNGGASVPSPNNWVKRSAANTGGTTTSPTIVSFDSSNAAATATVLLYSTNPGALGAGTVLVRSTANNSATGFGANTTANLGGGAISQPITLRGTAELYCFNGGADATTANVGISSFFWTEE